MPSCFGEFEGGRQILGRELGPDPKHWLLEDGLSPSAPPVHFAVSLSAVPMPLWAQGEAAMDLGPPQEKQIAS